MKDPRCTICHEKPLFPVRFQCFPCSSSNNTHKKNCSTLVMVCMHCADRYLELDKIPEERSFSKRCLFCDKTVHPFALDKESAYEIMYPLMDLDDSTYSCRHLGCFYEGSHLDLLDHMQNQCEYRKVRCRECFIEYQHVFEEMHKMNQPCHTQCSVCDDYIPTQRFTQHMEDDHAHYAHCSECDEYIFQFSYGFHMKEKHQARECRYCGKWIPHSEENHVDKCEGVMECPLCCCIIPTFLLSKEVSLHLQAHRTLNDTLLQKYQELQECYQSVSVVGQDDVLHTEWIRKVIREKRKESRVIHKFIKKHERWWI